MNRYSLCLLVSFLSFYSTVDSQETQSPSHLFSYAVRAHKAFVLIHSEDVREIENSYPNGLEVDFAWQRRDEVSWDKCHCFPRMGLAAQFWDFDNKEVLGYGLNTYFYVEPEFGASKFYSFSFRGGFGASFLTQPHHETENPDNQSYSTPVAFALIVAVRNSFRLSPQTRLEVSGFYNHISNGGVKEPNKGINYPSLSLGIVHHTSAPEYPNYVKNGWDKSKRKVRHDITFLTSWKQMSQGVHVFSPGAEFKVSRQIARINALTGGVEYLYDNFARWRGEKQGQNDPWSKVSVAAGHEFLLGQLIFSQQIGVYLYAPSWKGAALYQRYGLHYYFIPNWAVAVNVKAHGHVAYLVDFRLTRSF